MKIAPFLARPLVRSRGYALLVVMMFTGVSLIVLGTTMKWSNNNSTLNQRNNEYFATLAAAEAATEKVLAKLGQDYQSGGETLVVANSNSYPTIVPTTAESSHWTNYQFSNAQGTTNRTYVQRLVSATTNLVALQSQYSGLSGYASTYRVVSNAKQPNSVMKVSAGVKQDIQLATIPIFQFAIFYSLDCEINPGANMTVSGRVHSNSNLYTRPDGVTLTFGGDVTAAGKIFTTQSPLDPNNSRSQGTVTYSPGVQHDAGVNTLTLPIGTNNSSAAIHGILEVPPSAEDPTSAMGKQRMYNQADMIVVVSNSSVTVKSGYVNNFGTTIPSGEYNQFLNFSNSFYNYREAKTINGIQLDVGKLKTWSATNSSLRTALGGRDIMSIYVADMRTQSPNTEPALSITNGSYLPPNGLTVVTPNPLYVKGHYNLPSDGTTGSTNTSLTKPAALIGDAITVLSSAWADGNSLNATRNASSTTVNAAFLGGIVPSNGTTYSGGVENFPRFLENWSGDTLTYNGSMVVMFYSQTATAPWGGSGVYSPPTRQWAFDVNFLNQSKLPPLTPQARALVRGEWAAVAPNNIN